MKKLDSYSYQCGVIDCFNEIVAAGVKKIALSHPISSQEEGKQYLSFCKKICEQYHTNYYEETDPLITDLFPVSMNLHKFNFIFYKDNQFLQEYLQLKQKKKNLVSNHSYFGKNRYEIAYQYGKLLSYSEKSIQEQIQQNQEKEE